MYRSTSGGEIILHSQMEVILKILNVNFGKQEEFVHYRALNLRVKLQQYSRKLTQSMAERFS